MDHVTSVIVHYNTPKETLACITSLVEARSNSFQHHILVVDNGSKEVLVLPPKLERHRRITLVRSDANLGFAGGNNLGIRYAISNYNSDFILLLNSDARIEANCLELLLQTARKRPSLGLINPKIYFTAGCEYHRSSYHANELGKVLWFAGGSIDWADVVSFHRGVDEVDRDQFVTASQTDFATGCCVLIRREVIETVGLLSEKLFLYWEDVEYSLRTLERGYQIALQPQAVAWHDNAGSSDGAGNITSLYYQTRNRLHLAFTWGDWKAKVAAARLGWKYLQGNSIEQRAVFDAIIGRMGKQTLA